MKKFLNSKYFEAIVFTAAACLNLLFTLIAYSVKLLPDWGNESIWTVGTLKSEFTAYILRFDGFSDIFVIAFFIGVALLILSALLMFLKNKKIAFYFLIPYSIVVNLSLLFIHIGFKILSSGAVACLIIGVLISCAQLIYLIVKRAMTKEIKEDKKDEADETQAAHTPRIKNPFVGKLILLVCEVLTTILAFTVFFIPLYSTTGSASTETFVLIDALSDKILKESAALQIYVSFMAMFVAFLASLVFFVSTLPFFFKSDRIFVKKSKQYIYGNTTYLLIFFILGYCMSFIENLNGERASTVSYIPLIFSIIFLIVFSVVQGLMGYGFDGENILTAKKVKIESLIYVILLTCITYVSLILNIIEIHVEAGNYTNDVCMNGYEMLTTYSELGGGLQALAFMLFAILLISGILFVFSLVSFFIKYKDYDKVIKTTAITNAFFVLLIGLSGVYFKIAQAINIENIESILKYYGVSLSLNYVYTITSKSIYIFIASFIVLLVMLIRGQFSADKLQPSAPAVDNPPVNQQIAPLTEVRLRESEPAEQNDFDACPAFTELDEKTQIYNGELAKRRESLFENLTLPNLVRFVVDYARECRLHLSYSVEDMATFVAGLGASRLTILQGMSGTGKTSLPKIFAEAVMGNCEIVEVESSWRDKNELMGYYNEFSKCFTPKKFTQCLYKAKLNSTVPTFIVLDEMNLSRIEYYFSDFLSLMEHEEDKREIKLLNLKLYRTKNGKKKSYSALTDGHTIKIPANIWFIGTANRDESTFEISDKVYDRAQTMNFYRRAPKIHSFSEPLSPRFVAYDMITTLFENAKTDFTFDAESNAIIQKVEKLLIPYNISFGNRILRQMEDFVKIYCACFTDRDAVINEAVEKILLSKVVCKLEYKIVENKEALAVEFDKLNLTACSAFIRRLNED